MVGIKNNRAGITSLITVLIVSIILSIMVIGFVRIAIKEQRQSTDSDLSARALYAAEAGLEDTIQALRVSTFSKDTCPPQNGAGVLSSPTEMDMEYTCQLVDLKGANYETVLAENQSVTIPLTNDFTQMTVEWHTPALDGAITSLRSDTNLPAKSSWTSPAMLKVYFFGYDGSFNRNELNSSVSVTYLSPTSSLSNITLNSVTGNSLLGIKNASCNANADPSSYACSQTFLLNNGGGRDHVLRLTSLYRKASIRVSLRDGNQPVPITGVQAIVDITGRAGDVYRRVESRVDLGSKFVDYLPDHAITSTSDICKNAEIPMDTTIPTWASFYQANDCSRD